MIQEIKKSLSNITLIAVILGSLFAACYFPAMQMTARTTANASSQVLNASASCCEKPSNHHNLVAVGIPANPANLESLLILLSLSILLLSVKNGEYSLRDFINARLQHGRQSLLRLFDYLIQLFSRGVLHPKLYNA